MQHTHHVLKIFFSVSALIYIITLFMYPSLPEKRDIVEKVLKTDPIQKEASQKPITIKFEKVDYELVPQYDYSFYGLVVSQHDTKSFSDVSHYEDPANTKDICIIWGKNIVNGTYKEVSYESGDFTCFVKWGHPLDPPFTTNQLANNHIIPANSEVAHAINQVRIGDQIHIQGKLVNYSVQSKEGQQLFTRPTSTTREDMGNGACEIVYVEQLAILQKGAIEFYTVQSVAKWVAISSFAVICLLFFWPHKPGVY